MEKNFENNNENSIEFLSGQRTVTFSFTARKWINKIKQYAQSHPDEVDFAENEDGSICGHIPYKWFKISPPRQVNLTEEQKQERADRMRRVALERKKKK